MPEQPSKDKVRLDLLLDKEMYAQLRAKAKAMKWKGSLWGLAVKLMKGQIEARKRARKNGH